LSQPQASPPIGLIAGYGRFPLLAAQAMRARGLKVVVAAIKEEADPTIAEQADELHWLHVGQLGKMLKLFHKAGVVEAMMAGKVHKTHVWDLRPDLKAVSVLMRMRNKKDDTILGAIADEMGREGITLIESTRYTGDLIPGPGLIAGKITPEIEADIAFGFPLARAIGGLDIGQTVVVKNQAVMAVEAIEGTDAAIRRGGELGKGGVTVCKVAKPNQDLRFDVPAIGPDTLRALIAAGGGCLAFEAGATFCFDRDEVVALAQANGVTVVAWDGLAT